MDRISSHISCALPDLELHLLEDLTSAAVRRTQVRTDKGLFHHSSRKLLEQLSLEAQGNCFPEQNSEGQ